jgi:hypothetical protein
MILFRHMLVLSYLTGKILLNNMEAASKTVPVFYSLNGECFEHL